MISEIVFFIIFILIVLSGIFFVCGLATRVNDRYFKSVERKIVGDKEENNATQ